MIVPGPPTFGPLNGFQSLRRMEDTDFTLVGQVARSTFHEGRAAVLGRRASAKVVACGKLTEAVGGAGVLEL